MRNAFTTGVILGGVVGAALSMATTDKNTDTRRRVMRKGRTMLRRAGSIMTNVADFMR